MCGGNFQKTMFEEAILQNRVACLEIVNLQIMGIIIINKSKTSGINRQTKNTNKQRTEKTGK